MAGVEKILNNPRPHDAEPEEPEVEFARLNVFLSQGLHESNKIKVITRVTK